MATIDNRTALRIALTYALIAGIWIAGSDALLSLLFKWPSTAIFSSVVKGLLFVAFTSGGLFAVLHREFSLRRQAEDVMRRNETLYQTLAQHFPDGAVFLFDKSIKFVVSGGTALTALSALSTTHDVAGKHVADVFDPATTAALEPRMRAALDGEHIVFNLDVGDQSYQATCFALRDAKQGVQNGMLLIQDVTARRSAEAAVLQERMRISRDLHDSVSQALYGIGLATHTARTLLQRDPSRLNEPLDYIASITEMGTAELRGLLFELRPDSLEVEGLVIALKKQAAAVHAQHGIDVATHLCDEPEVRLQLKETMYRIAQEAMHNIVKHAKAKQVTLTLTRQPNELRLVIVDNGVGLPAAGPSRPGMGLRSMRERAERVGGSVAIHSEPGQFTKVEAVVPI